MNEVVVPLCMWKEDIPGPSVSSYRPNATKPTPQVVKIYPFKIPRQEFPEDRFIRRRFNVEASHYLLTKKTEETAKENQIDVFKQVDSLSVTWRKKLMHKSLVHVDVIPGLKQKHVLGGSHLSMENRASGSFAGIPKELRDEECCEDGMWKSKPRKRPLISTTESVLDMPGFQALPRRRSPPIDWSSRNIIVGVIQDLVTFYDTLVSDTVKTLNNIKVVGVCALKWNNAGDKVAIGTLVSDVNLYCVQKQKMLWTTTCKSLVKYNLLCYVRCICWSQNDQHIVTGCYGLISVYSASSGRLIKSGFAHTKGLLKLAFSSDYRYLVSTSLDKNVRIFQWPGLIPYLDITYNEPIKALAWHPYESGLLCIGGGLGDASLSLWNVNKLVPVSYRHVQFHGNVENLAWNKQSAELVVHWTYWEDQEQYTVMPVLASLDRIVDVLPLDKESRVSTVMWNSEHTQLATQCDCLLTWNFFANEYPHRQEHKKSRKGVQSKNFITFNGFKRFSIR